MRRACSSWRRVLGGALAAALLAAVFATLAMSCATTKPWQREQLAEPVMAPDGDGDREALRDHMLRVREGRIGGFGGGGGGCGCN